MTILKPISMNGTSTDNVAYLGNETHSSKQPSSEGTKDSQFHPELQKFSSIVTHYNEFSPVFLLF